MVVVVVVEVMEKPLNDDLADAVSQTGGGGGGGSAGGGHGETTQQ